MKAIQISSILLPFQLCTWSLQRMNQWCYQQPKGCEHQPFVSSMTIAYTCSHWLQSMSTKVILYMPPDVMMLGHAATLRLAARIGSGQLMSLLRISSQKQSHLSHHDTTWTWVDWRIRYRPRSAMHPRRSHWSSFDSVGTGGTNPEYVSSLQCYASNRCLDRPALTSAGPLLLVGQVMDLAVDAIMMVSRWKLQHTASVVSYSEHRSPHLWQTACSWIVSAANMITKLSCKTCPIAPTMMQYGLSFATSATPSFKICHTCPALTYLGLVDCPAKLWCHAIKTTEYRTPRVQQSCASFWGSQSSCYATPNRP